MTKINLARNFTAARALAAAHGGLLGFPRAEGVPTLESLATVFAAYHGETKTMAADITKLTAALEDQAKMLSRMELHGAIGGDRPTPAALRAALKDMHAFMRGKPRGDLSVTVDPEGGYTTQPELDSAIGQYLENINPMRRLARIVTSTSGDFQIPFNTGQAASGWVGEKQSRPNTDSPNFSLLDYPSREVYAEPRATQKILDDSAFNIEDFLKEEILKEFARQEGAAFVGGDGILKPRGFMDYRLTSVTTDDASRAFGVLQYVPSGASGTFPAVSGVSGSTNPDALVTMVYKLRAGYRANARWVMNSNTAGVIRKMKDKDGRYIWAEPLSAGQPPVLLGYPVEICEDMADIAADSYPIAFGDFRSGYIIIDRIGVRLLRDPYTTKGWVNFYATKRVGGGLVDSRAIKLLKMSAT